MIGDAEQAFQLFASYVALAVEVAAIIIVAGGSVEAVASSARRMILQNNSRVVSRRVIWVRFASWILLSLEFALGADIIRTAISPSWDAIGKLAAIAAIRTGLNYFLQRDLEEAASMGLVEPEMRRRRQPVKLRDGV